MYGIFWTDGEAYRTEPIRLVRLHFQHIDSVIGRFPLVLLIRLILLLHLLVARFSRSLIDRPIFTGLLAGVELLDSDDSSNGSMGLLDEVKDHVGIDDAG
jgi:hypothetical protein